jgi:anti-sigma regulatory factor (Ser/Thr protein kinase)
VGMMVVVRELKPAEPLTHSGSAEGEGLVPVTPQTRAPSGPANGSAWRPARPGQSRPMNAGMLALGALPSSPFWARRYTRRFLDSCQGMTESTADTAELLVSELVTNAVRFSGDPARPLRYSERASAGLISLSLRHFREGLLIEVFDTDANPPVLSDPDLFAENGRGLMLVDTMAKQWSYFFPPGGGKVVYCFLEIALTRGLGLDYHGDDHGAPAIVLADPPADDAAGELADLVRVADTLGGGQGQRIFYLR